MLAGRRFDAADAVYVVMDARRSPARELAIEVIAEQERLSGVDARRALDARAEIASRMGTPFILGVVVQRATLMGSAAARSLAAAEVLRWLGGRLPESHCRVLLLAGKHTRMDFMRVETSSRCYRA